jgi:hypothetical protein
MTDRGREWTVQHLPWIITALLALWLPPLLYGVAVDVGLAQGSGYPGLTDPATLMPAVELSAMIAAIPRLAERKQSGWTLLLWSRVAVLAQTLWTFFVGARLTGVMNTLGTRTILVASAGLMISAYVLIEIRPLYGPPRRREPSRRPAREGF